VKEVTFFNVDYVSKTKSLIDGYLEVYEGLCDVKKVHKKKMFFFLHLILFHSNSIIGFGNCSSSTPESLTSLEN
jgi:hypothetical protein